MNATTNLYTNEKKVNNGSWIAVFYFIITILLYTLPSFKITFPYIFVGIFMLAFLPFAMLKGTKELNYVMTLLITTILTLLLNNLLGIYGFVDSINEGIRNIRFFMPALWAVYVIKNFSKKRIFVLVILFSIITGFVLSKTMVALEQDPWITRILAQDKATDSIKIRAFRMQNVGGFEFSYMMGIVTLCFTWLAINFKKVLLKILSVIGAILCFYYIIQTMYTTLLILTSIGIVLLVMFCFKNPIMKFSFVIICIVGLFSFAPICLMLSESFGDSLLSTKFLMIYKSLTGEGVDALGSRPGYLMDAFNCFLMSPIWGGYKADVATHSMLFALLANNGIFGITMFLIMFTKTRKIVICELKNKNVSTLFYNVVLLYVFVLAILNPIGYVFEVCIAAFFIVPLLMVCASDLNLVNDKEKKNIENTIIEDTRK